MRGGGVLQDNNFGVCANIGGVWPENQRKVGEIVKEDGNLLREDGEIIKEDGDLPQEDDDLIEEDGNLHQEDDDLAKEDDDLLKEDDKTVPVLAHTWRRYKWRFSKDQPLAPLSIARTGCTLC